MALKIVVGVLIAILMGGIAFGFYRTIPPADTSAPVVQGTCQVTNTNMHSVTIGTDSTSSPLATVQVQVANTDASREQGLSDCAGLAPNTGMLFQFDSAGVVQFWMKDMQFSLDMLFIDSNGTIVTISQNLSPSTYNAEDPSKSQVFSPKLPVLYVLEVPAGFAAANGIKEGQQVTFK